MSDVVLTLGDVEFADFEIPEEIPLGGPLLFKVHKQQGGGRIVDALGNDWAPITWSGRFRGPDGFDRARALDRTKAAGGAISLTFGELAYTVLIVGFDWRFRGNNEYPYTIILEVISDDASPNADGQDVSATEMITGDFADASSAVGGIAALAGPMSTLQSAVSSVRDFASATKSQIASVLAPLSAAENQVQTLIGGAETVLDSVQAVGGVVAGVGGADLASGLLAQVSAMQDSADLYDADALFGRMGKNLAAIGSSGTHLIVAGYDLFQIAETQYGDATEWSTIASANGIADPIGTGITELVIPPRPTGSGGVLS